MSRETAIHEAGHAVIGRVLGMVCGGASVVADGDSAGHSICGDPWEIAGAWDARERNREISLVFRGRILAFMAGSEAERVIFGSCGGCDGDDRYQIEMMAASDDCDFNGAQWSWCEPRMRATARRLVRRHRAAIERVAAALLDRGTLSGDEVDALFGTLPATAL